MPCGIRTPVNDPFGGALSDRLGHQNRQRVLKLCFLHGRCHPEENAIRLCGTIFLQRDHVGSAGRHQAVHLDDPRGVDPTDGAAQIDHPAARFLDLQDEGSSSSEHSGVHILAPHTVEAWPVPPHSRKTSAAIHSFTLGGYLLPAPPPRAQPFPLQPPPRHPVLRTPPTSLPERPP